MAENSAFTISPALRSQ